MRKDRVLLGHRDVFRIMRTLEGKKVLVVSSFPKTIVSQYARRELVFPNGDLPRLSLSVEKAPITFADAIPDFARWEDSLQDCFMRCMKHDFEVALIGAGAYSNPLGPLLYRQGKKVVVLNSSIQIAFGIKGKRWETAQWAEGVRKLFIQYWVYPSAEEKPPGAEKVDNGSYWG